MFAPVRGSPSSWSQKIVWRYSSSATVACSRDTNVIVTSIVDLLPLKPPIQPQLARSAKELPEGAEWRYEPKWDGFRTIVFGDGDDVHLQSRNGKPMNRYFPEVIPAVQSLPSERIVLDGELIVVVDGIQEFDLLGQRIHPAKSRVDMLAEQWPAAFVAFDLLSEGDEVLMELPYSERRARLEAGVDLGPVQLTPMSAERQDAAGACPTG